MITIIGRDGAGRPTAYSCNVIEWGYEFWVVPVTADGATIADKEGEQMEWRTVEELYVGLDSGQYTGDMTATDLGRGVLQLSYTGGSGSGSS